MHRATAAEVFGTPPDEVTSEQRRYAKVINFGLIYGMSAFGLARNLGIERARGAELHGQLLRALSRRGARTWSARATRRASSGYVETVFGRRLWLPDIRSSQQAAPRRAPSARRSTRRCRAPRRT